MKTKLEWYYNRVFNPLYIVYVYTVAFFFCFISIFVGQIVGYLFGICSLSVENTLIAFPLALIMFWILHYAGYKRMKKWHKSTATFTYKQFTEWYRLNSSRISMTNKGFYYELNENGKSLYIVPKTFKDYILFAWKIEKIYRDFSGVESISLLK